MEWNKKLLITFFTRTLHFSNSDFWGISYTYVIYKNLWLGYLKNHDDSNKRCEFQYKKSEKTQAPVELIPQSTYAGSPKEKIQLHMLELHMLGACALSFPTSCPVPWSCTLNADLVLRRKLVQLLIWGLQSIAVTDDPALLPAPSSPLEVSRRPLLCMTSRAPTKWDT